jgi:HTH-type transcriptional regulator, transcriptional repressor of NAD biosynthesis genes
VRARRGLIIGKFWPPHRGHHHAINALSQRCEQVVIVLCAAQSQQPDSLERALWLQAVHPRAEVVVVEDLCAWHHPEPCPLPCTDVWVAEIARLGMGRIDVVAAGEEYGERFAAGLGAELFPLDRTAIQLSATAVRSDLSAHWGDLHPVVRRGLHRRVVVLGAESTGTSTLAADLARTLGAPLVGEVGRTMSWVLYAAAGSMQEVTWTEQHFWTIIDRQIAAEHDALLGAVETPPGVLGPWLVCDTDTLATIAWWERYLRTDASAMAKLAQNRLADLYVLTSPQDVAFDETDPLRDGEAHRDAMHQRMRELLAECGRPFVEVTGSPADRCERVVSEIEEFERAQPRWVFA